jgi:hypothetical protein
VTLDASPNAKDPKRQALGRAAMRSRWGPQRVLRLDQLDPITADIVRAILAARANAAAASDPDKV